MSDINSVSPTIWEGTYHETIHFSSILRSNTPPECPRRTLRISADIFLGPKLPAVAVAWESLDFPDLLPPAVGMLLLSTGVETRSQTHTVQSLLPLTMKPRQTPSLPRSQSRSNLRHNTLPVWPSKEATHLPVLMHQTLIDRSREPEMIRDESKSRQ